MTRTKVTDDKEFVVARLKEIAKGKPMEASYWIAKSIEEKGLIKAEYLPNPAGRGRTIKIFSLTGKGKRQVDIAERRELIAKEERKVLKEARAAGRFSNIGTTKMVEHSAAA